MFPSPLQVSKINLLKNKVSVVTHFTLDSQLAEGIQVTAAQYTSLQAAISRPWRKIVAHNECHWQSEDGRKLTCCIENSFVGQKIVFQFKLFVFMGNKVAVGWGNNQKGCSLLMKESTLHQEISLR